MSLDAQAMLEVNRQALLAAAQSMRERGVERPVVVSVATFGRGVRQDLLKKLEGYRHCWGHNQSMVATPPLDVLGELMKDSQWQPPAQPAGGFWVLGYAFGKTCLQHWSWDPHHESDLF